MRDKIVIIESFAAAAAAVAAATQRGKRSDLLVLLHGKWGHGKTTFIEWFHAHNLCFYARALAAWSRSVNWMVEDLLRAYRVEASGRLKRDLRELVQVMKKHGAPLFIDEAQRLCARQVLIETVRDLHDLARVPIVLVGQENIVNLLHRQDLGQVFSRITEIVEFRELSVSDVQQVAKELCDLGCADNVASFIHTTTLGDFRLLNMLLGKIEELCHLNRAPEITLSIARAAAKITPQLDEPARPRALEETDSPDRKLAVG
jgi:DNA transposition AAA+ family ATPase